MYILLDILQLMRCVSCMFLRMYTPTPPRLHATPCSASCDACLLIGPAAVWMGSHLSLGTCFRQCQWNAELTLRSVCSSV